MLSAEIRVFKERIERKGSLLLRRQLNGKNVLDQGVGQVQNEKKSVKSHCQIHE